MGRAVEAAAVLAVGKGERVPWSVYAGPLLGGSVYWKRGETGGWQGNRVGRPRGEKETTTIFDF